MAELNQMTQNAPNAEKVYEKKRGPKLDNSQKPKITRFSAVIVATALLVSAIAGGFIGYSIVSRQINDLQNQVTTLQRQLINLESTSNDNHQNTTYVLNDNTTLSGLYEEIKNSVVIVRGVITQNSVWGTYYTQVQGSGFVCNLTGQEVIVTNYHVVQNAINITVTFINGNGYAATILGSDSYADLAVLSTNAPLSEYKPLKIITSSTLNVGDPVIAMGTPYGLAGSMTTGIVSALGRTITEEMSGGYLIADVIQTSAPINPGNSGGPLLNYLGQVVGITTAIVSNSQGVGFAIPSSTILREIESLITKGSYDQHPWLGATGTDMTYEISRATDTNITYGWLITQVVSGGPADAAGLRAGVRQVLISGNRVTIGGDIVIAINETKITNMDDLSAYLEEHSLPGQTINVTIIRNNQIMTVSVKLGTRPQTSASLV
jgi:S1-C subfamily serine protease